MKSLIRPPTDDASVREWYAVGRPVVEQLFRTVAGQDSCVDVVELCVTHCAPNAAARGLCSGGVKRHLLRGADGGYDTLVQIYRSRG